MEVFLGDLRIDLPHGGNIGPAAGAHGDFFRDAQVVGQGGKRSAEAVDTDLWQIVLLAEPVNGLPDLVGVTGVDQRVALICVFHRLTELGKNEGDGPAGSGVFILLALDQLTVFVLDGSTMDMDTVVYQVDIVPAEGKNLGPAEAGQGQQGGDFTAFAVNGFQEGGDLLGGEEGEVIGYHLREPDGYLGAGGILDHRGEKAPGIFKGFGGTQFCLCVYDPLPLVRCGGGNIPLHGGLESGAGDGPVPTDGGWGQDILPGGDIGIHGLLYRRGRGFFGLPGTGLQGHGLFGAFLCRGFGDGDGFAVNLDTDVPGAGGEFAGFR